MIVKSYLKFVNNVRERSNLLKIDAQNVDVITVYTNLIALWNLLIQQVH
jgi:hypothetical protein